MITSLSKKIIEVLITVSKTEPDSETIEVYIYGLECFFNTFLTVFLLMIWSFLTGTIKETGLWIITFYVLRQYSGGFHAKTQFSCIMISYILGMLDGILIMNVHYSRGITWIIIIICNIICAFYAPAKTSKRNFVYSMRKNKKRKVFMILDIGFLIALLLQSEISISIIYANVCVCLLLVLNVVTNKIIE